MKFFPKSFQSVLQSKWPLTAVAVALFANSLWLSSASADRNSAPLDHFLLAAAPAHKKPASAVKKPTEPKKSKEATAKEIDASIATAVKVEPLELLQKPAAHLKQKVTFAGTFNRFADTALDYKKAFRDSRDYVSFFILRPDVGEKTIPLSEMKLFFPRKKSDEVMDLEPGDKIQIVGTPFSTALDEPWVDVEHIKIVQKTTKSERKHTPEF
jgi:hypothetical protein